MKLLFTDQAEFYIVCDACYADFSRAQWTGSTRGHGNWREVAEQALRDHVAAGKGCEFCDPIIGNGGWFIAYAAQEWPAIARRNAHRKELGLTE